MRSIKVIGKRCIIKQQEDFVVDAVESEVNTSLVTVWKCCRKNLEWTTENIYPGLKHGIIKNPAPDVYIIYVSYTTVQNPHDAIICAQQYLWNYFNKS